MPRLTDEQICNVLRQVCGDNILIAVSPLDRIIADAGYAAGCWEMVDWPGEDTLREIWNETCRAVPLASNSETFILALARYQDQQKEHLTSQGIERPVC